MFFSKFLKLATVTLFFSNPFLLESLNKYQLPFTESTAQAQTVFTPSPQAANRWQVLTSKDAQFSVLMPPGNPQKDIVEKSSGQYKIQFHSFALPDQKGLYYLVAHTNILPFLPESMTPEEQEVFFEAFAKGMLSQVPNAQVRSTRSLTSNDFLGQEMDVEAPDGVFVRMRIFLANSRIYMLMVGMETPSLAQSADVSQFFDSFNLVDSQTPVVSQKRSKSVFNP
ncbi:MAG: hypothetical protein SWJ54_20970 [Cyanobacteriota bacterium]|nr:hypothetical protein [Cyanobacteriota bacterium]